MFHTAVALGCSGICTGSSTERRPRASSRRQEQLQAEVYERCLEGLKPTYPRQTAPAAFDLLLADLSDGPIFV
jgi:hypothetical protein